ncbi:MAG TPA: phosphoglucosamine mutase [Chthonomonadales bacterium]|nr:phosphoglucosamine mutase [Chthonomonadales bacterium]
MANERLFGTDGVRGIANKGLTAPLALRLGMAAGHWMRVERRKETGALSVASRPVPSDWPGAPDLGADRPLVVIGRDTRVSGDMLEAALVAGLAAMGVDVVNIGIAPTPAVARIVLARGAAGGVVISASHNPFEDNGIKFFGPNGKKLPDAVEDQIERHLADADLLDRPYGERIGRISETCSLLEEYIEAVAATVPGKAPLKGMKLVVDCANGAAHKLAPLILSRLGAEIEEIHTEPDGSNINRQCGSTHPESMMHCTRAAGACAGLALDGDADRVMLADEHGARVDGDRMMAIIALDLHVRNRLPGAAVVATVMSNVGLEHALSEDGIRLHRSAVGDRYVAEEMDSIGAAVGGEQSGHILLPQITPTGDGIVTALQVLRIMQETGKPLSELAGRVKSYPQVLRNIKVTARKGRMDDPEIAKVIADLGSKLGNPQWLSVRASGTEPLIRVMAQGDDDAVVNSVVSEICAIIEKKLGKASEESAA